ncbi:MAG: hypothetical protein DWC07_01730 [Candidatus Poseidoniales archaeon]|nr:MAG: hypothetical protein DWC07_01730 [Candidatus Poseidoniales archaeon]
MGTMNETWIGRTLTVATSTDPTLSGRQGIVLDETKNTLTLMEGEHTVVLNKNSIAFNIDNSDVVVQGATVSQRPEDRIHRRYRKA